MFAKVDELNVAVVPIVTEGAFTGGLVFASDEADRALDTLAASPMGQSPKGQCEITRVSHTTSAATDPVLNPTKD
jgi:hypothetical protein